VRIETVTMPKLGESVTEGTVDHWLKKEGELVRRDESLVEVVTDKVNAEIPSPFEGRLIRIQVQDGQTVPIGSVIAEMEVEGIADDLHPGAPPISAESAQSPISAQVVPHPEPMSPTLRSRTQAPLSPVVRRLAEEHGVDISLVTGSGMHGRVRREDVQAYIAARAVNARSTEAREELVRISPVRRQIAEHMVKSVSAIPHAWAMREVEMTALVGYREEHKKEFGLRHGMPLSYLPFVIQVVADALKANPFVNSSWTDEGIVLKRYINIGIAVALPDALIVPVIKDADRMGLVDLARSVVDLSNRARNRALKLEDVQDGTFTLNNTGALGGLAGMAIINHPQAAILNTESIVRRPVGRGDSIVLRDMMYLTMSFDHRILDGLQANHFMQAVQDSLESWTPASIRF